MAPITPIPIKQSPARLPIKSPYHVLTYAASTDSAHLSSLIPAHCPCHSLCFSVSVSATIMLRNKPAPKLNGLQQVGQWVSWSFSGLAWAWLSLAPGHELSSGLLYSFLILLGYSGTRPFLSNGRVQAQPHKYNSSFHLYHVY